jgi:hypothetical protein
MNFVQSVSSSAAAERRASGRHASTSTVSSGASYVRTIAVRWATLAVPRVRDIKHLAGQLPVLRGLRIRAAQTGHVPRAKPMRVRLRGGRMCARQAARANSLVAPHAHLCRARQAPSM